MLIASEISVSPQFQIYPKLKLFIVENCGKNISQNHRLELRELLVETLRDFHYSYPSSLLNVSLRPLHPQITVSLSHSLDTSCFAWVENSHGVGVDIENRERLKEETIKRMSSQQEMLQVPNWELLWSAKEAVFKCFSSDYNVMSSVEIFDWKKSSENSWIFSAREEKSKKILKGKGEIRLNLKHSIAFFSSPP